MPVEITVRNTIGADDERVSRLVIDSFQEFVGHEYTEEGVEEFLKYALPEALARRRESGHFQLVACIEGELVGMIESRDNRHLSMLFVDRRFHRQGVARQLLQAALRSARQKRPDLSRITVHSSRFAVPVYRKLGFVQIGDEQTVNGIIFVPMELRLRRGELTAEDAEQSAE